MCYGNRYDRVSGLQGVWGQSPFLLSCGKEGLRTCWGVCALSSATMRTPGKGILRDRGFTLSDRLRTDSVPRQPGFSENLLESVEDFQLSGHLAPQSSEY